MPDYKLREPGSILINGQPNEFYYVVWSEAGRSRRRSTGKVDEDAAEKFLVKFRAAMDAPPEQFDLAMIFDGYLEHKPEQVHQLKAARRILGRLTMDELTPSQVRMFHTARRAEGVSDSTINKQCRMVQAARERRRYLTRDEFQALYMAADTPHLRAFLALGVWTGQRMSAILELKWEDVRDGMIWFPESPTDTKRRAINVGMNIPLMLTLGEALLIRDSDYIVSWLGEPVKSVKTTFYKAVMRAGLDDVRIHDLRRTCGSWMAIAGVTEDRIAHILADDVATVRKHYMRLSPDFHRDTMGAIA